MDIFSKIRKYGDATFHAIYKKNLWNLDSSEAVLNYATKVINAPGNPVGDLAIVVYGDIDSTSSKGPLTNLNTGEVTEWALVDTPSEYYFTDMVFIQHKYEEALVDLYTFRAKGSFTMQGGYRDMSHTDEAIHNTYWIAEQNGVTINKDDIYAQFMTRLDEHMAPFSEILLNKFTPQQIPNIDMYVNEFVSSIKDYYANPSQDAFENVIKVAYAIEASCDSDLIAWDTFFMNLEFTDTIVVVFRMYVYYHPNKFSMVPKQISPVEISHADPVEISANETTLVFGSK